MQSKYFNENTCLFRQSIKSTLQLSERESVDNIYNVLLNSELLKSQSSLRLLLHKKYPPECCAYQNIGYR